ncbi:MAG: transglutaminase domain-containing protein [Candidatus Melainabacteria bacterium]|nr:transglutaminase domain-containing protein [Candidatus Melainabacteria bacterium]
MSTQADKHPIKPVDSNRARACLLPSLVFVSVKGGPTPRFWVCLLLLNLALWLHAAPTYAENPTKTLSASTSAESISAQHTLVESTLRWSAQRPVPFARTATYCEFEITPPAGDSPFTPDALLPATRRQQPSAFFPQGVRMTVRQQKPFNPLWTLKQAKSARERLFPPVSNPNSPRLQALATGLIANETNVYAAAETLRQWVYQSIAPSLLSFSNPDQPLKQPEATLETQQGNSFEKAFLLTSLLQSLDIPARTVAGVYYQPVRLAEVPGEWVAHAWTEIGFPSAANAQTDWYPLDPNLASASVDATHLALFTTGPHRLTQQADGLHPADRTDIQSLGKQLQQWLQRNTLHLLTAEGVGQSVVRLDKPLMDPNDLTTNAHLHPTGGSEGRLAIDLQSPGVRQATQQNIQTLSTVTLQQLLNEDSAESKLEMALQSMANGAFSTAEQQLTALVNRTQNPLEAYQLGQQLLSQELYPQAALALQKAGGEARLRPWIEALRQERFPESMLPDSEQQRYAQALLQQYQPASQADALSTLEALADTYPQFSPVHLALGDAYQRISRLQQAVQSFQTFQQQRPQDPRGWMALARLYDSQQDYAAASQANSQALRLARQAQSAPNRRLVNELAGQQTVLLAMEQLKVAPRSAAAWHQLGSGLHRLGQPTEAIKAIDSALVLNPQLTPARLLQAQLALESNHWERLERIMPKINALGPQSAKARYLLGLYQMKKRLYPSAIQSLQRAIRQDPSLSEAYLKLAETYDSTRQPDQAIQTLRQGLSRVKEADRLPLALSLADHLAIQKPVEAYQQLERVLVQHPEEPEAYRLAGQLYMAENRLAEAHYFLVQGLAVSPYHPMLLTTLGDYYSLAGEPNQAAVYYRKAIIAQPHQPEASQAYRLLITEQNWQVPKPTVYRALDSDSHRYLVQFYREQQAYQQNTLAIYQALEKTMGRYGSLGLEEIRDREASALLLQQYEQRLQKQYQQLNQMAKPPANMQPLHEALQKQLWARLYWASVLKATLPFVYDSRMASTTQQYAAAAERLQNRMDSWVDYRLRQLSIEPLHLQAVQSEAGLKSDVQSAMLNVRKQFESKLSVQTQVVTQGQKLSDSPTGAGSQPSNAGRVQRVPPPPR